MRSRPYRPRRLLILPALAGVLALTGCTARDGAADRPPVGTGPVADASGKVYFDMADPRGDDKGPGRYTYPTSFQGRFGFLDIRRFKVEDAGRFVSFLVEFRRPIDRARLDGSTEAKNYFLQLVDIYIDKDGKANSGRSWALPGRNLEFDERSGWEKCVLVTPGHSRSLVELIRQRSSDQQLYRSRNDIFIPERVYPRGYELKILVPKDQLGGEPQPHWGYQVFAMGYDSRNLAYQQLQNTSVHRFADEDDFGGGTDNEGDTNVLDILAPTAEEQYRWLSDYVSRQNRSGNRYAVVPMIRLPEGGSVLDREPAPAPAAPLPVAAAPALAAPLPPAPPALPPRPALPPVVSSPAPGTAAAPAAPSSNRIDSRYRVPESQTPRLSAPEFSFEMDPGAKY